MAGAGALNDRPRRRDLACDRLFQQTFRTGSECGAAIESAREFLSRRIATERSEQGVGRRRRRRQSRNGTRAIR